MSKFRKIRLLIILVLGGTAMFLCQCNNKKTGSDTGIVQGDSARIKFENPTHDFGEIEEGEKVSTVYKFKNVGSMPLQIFDVQVSCGCTVASKPEVGKPIAICPFWIVPVIVAPIFLLKGLAVAMLISDYFLRSVRLNAL